MGERVHIPIGLRILAAVCRVCPCCIVARRWPNSAFARQFRKVQHRCPFCKAREKVRHILIAAAAEEAEAVPVRRADAGL